MPTVSVNRGRLFTALEETFPDETFDELCFDFGIEIDDVTTAEKIIRMEKHLSEEPETTGNEDIIYKIDVPVNRFDLLCLEGLARGLRIFKGKEDVPTYNLAAASRTNLQKLIVKPEKALIRPYVVAAILRGITFNQARYDKLHQNICRKRTLVALGTHDLDTLLQGPFTFEVKKSPCIVTCVPLSCSLLSCFLLGATNYSWQSLLTVHDRSLFASKL